MNFLEAWDLGASYGMELLHRQEAWLSPLMHFISAHGDTPVIRIVTVLAALFFFFIGQWRTGVCFVATVLLAFAIGYGAKPWVNRPRPDLRWVESKDKSSSQSFPSGHALLSMAVYGSLALSLAAKLEKRNAAAVLVFVGLVLPLLIGFSRMYLGVHYMSDVVAGLSAGLGCVLLFRWIDLKWTASGWPRAAHASRVTVPFQSAPEPRALEQIQSSASDQIQP
jgi:undecaprenyl-diphosphatase